MSHYDMRETSNMVRGRTCESGCLQRFPFSDRLPSGVIRPGSTLWACTESVATLCNKEPPVNLRLVKIC